MGETAISPEALEAAMRKALPSLFPNLLETTSNARAEFYDKFQREAEAHDRDFIKKYDEDLNTTLIFAGLFSTVTTAFILDVQKKLEPDYQELSYRLLTIIANSSVGHTPTGNDAQIPPWTLNPTDTHTQAVLYSSLAISLLAAFIAVLGKQWLNRYAQVDMHGSVVDRSRRRQRKMNGVVTWHFDFIMECLPFMLQVALLLLGYALSDYLFFINEVVASIAIGFSSFGLLFYLLIVSAATFSYDCPFQTPPSLILRFLFRLDDEHKRYFKRSTKWLKRIFSQMNKKRSGPGSDGPYGPRGLGISGGSNPGDHIELFMKNSTNRPLPFLDEETDWQGYVLDSNCIAWMFKMSTDADAVMAVMKFIPEIIWHTDIRTTPLKKLYDTMVECFDRSSGCPVIIPKLKIKAYLSAKAFLHLAIQRKCFGDKSDEEVFKTISNRYNIMGSKHYEGDPDLEATLGIIDRVFASGNLEPMCWKNFTFTVPHHAWMGHILLYRAWDVLRKGDPLPNDIREFVLHSLQLMPLPPGPIVTDCLFIIGLALGINLHIGDLLVVDKSRECNAQIIRIYDKLSETFKNPASTTDKVDRALEAMELITPLSRDDIGRKSYELFHVAMQAPVSVAYSEEKKWKASRLALHGAYKWDKFLPWVGDPQDILAFLAHQFDLATQRGQDQDESIQDALRALAYASNDITIEALRHFDPTEPFVRGICYVFQNNRPFQLREAALLFLPLIGDKLFKSSHKFMEPDQIKSLCVDWASAVDSLNNTHDAQKATLTVFFDMIDSPHWRPHILTEKWELLKHFASVPGDSQPLGRCINNPELMNAIKVVGDPTAMAIWLKILWIKYEELNHQIRQQLQMATKEVARGGRKKDLDIYLSAIELELENAEKALTKYNTWSQDLVAIALREKVDSLQQTKDLLLDIRRG